jgi:peroxiredoxin
MSDDFESGSENSPVPPANVRVDERVKEAFENSGGTRFRLPPWATFAILIVVVAFASIGYFTTHNFQNGFFGPKPVPTVVVEDNEIDEIAKRQPLDDFTLTDAEGRQKKLSDYHGNVVILSFWASWCTPCLVELPTFAELEKKFYDRGLRIVAVNLDEGDDGKNFAKDFWPKQGFKIPSSYDTTKALSQKFDVEMLPSNFVIDRQGRLVFSGFGANDWNNQQTVDFIDGLLDERD